MKKARVPIDMDSRLKEAFIHRIEQLPEDLTLSKVIRAGMYSMMGLSDERFMEFINEGLSREALYSMAFDSMEVYKKEGLYPDDHELGNQNDLYVYMEKRAEYEKSALARAEERLQNIAHDLKKRPEQR